MNLVEILVSEPRGLGIRFDICPTKDVVFFSGGSGLFPFCDLIDILYK